MTDKFAQPHDVDLIMAQFGRVDHLMPNYYEIQEEYGMNSKKWSKKLFEEWFFFGIKSVDGLVTKGPVDKTKALRHIRAIMSSMDPSHEHKTAACAYLLDKWFDGEKSTWECAR